MLSVKQVEIDHQVNPVGIDEVPRITWMTSIMAVSG